MSGVKKVCAMMIAGLTLFGSLMVSSTVTVAAPQKSKKPPTKKAPTKKPSKKPDTKALVAAGKKVYDSNGCSACHAIAGKGGTSGPELTKTAADPKHDAKFFKTAIVDPKADSPDSAMPSYEETVKGKDLEGLIAYMQSLK
jgi:mono/diheme cytochrome c family protein